MSRSSSQSAVRRRVRAAARRAFTMLELLIAVSIMLILLAITATAIRVNNDVDRVRGAGRQVQSYLLGARDRAIYAKAPRGVRFLRDNSGNAADTTERSRRLVTSMVYVEPTEPWTGQVSILPFDTTLPWNAATNQLTRVRLRDLNTIPRWDQLNSRGLLTPGLRIKIPASTRGSYYAIQALDFSGGNQDLILSAEYRNPNPTGVNFEKALIELPPSVIPNEEPVQLPRGVAIDLDRCGGDWFDPMAGTLNLPPDKLPPSWVDGTGNYTNRMDLMFSPRGSITGPPAAQGIIHLYLTGTSNLTGVPTNVSLTSMANGSVTYAQLFDPAYGQNIAAGQTAAPPVVDKILTTIFTRTGHVTCSPVRTVDARNNQTNAVGPDGFADDPFYFAERGEVAGR